MIVLDSVGCGNAPDAAAYGDEGADTLGHLFDGFSELSLPNLDSLGLAGLIGRGFSGELRQGAGAFRLSEQSAGKDTTTGHWELMGCAIKEPFFTCESFPDEFVTELSIAGGTGFIGNKVASGTEILKELGEEHISSGKPILYTSADSVLQIAAHEEVFGLDRLLNLCRTARRLLDERNLKVGRVIARPFIGTASTGFQRTGNRHDYSLTPDGTVLDLLVGKGIKVIGVGKISDIFAGKGISVSYPTKDNAGGMAEIDRQWSLRQEGNSFIFANLVDFDSLYGHRRDPYGYARCLMEFDAWLGGFLAKVHAGDLVMLTADHGNDPYHRGTDHTREQVPCLIVSGGNACSGEMKVFSDVGRCVEAFFD